jgi:hypothetical protein
VSSVPEFFDHFAKCNNNSNSLKLKKRGRRIGSGAGVKRKGNEQYSENTNTKKARARYDNMNEIEKELHRAANADNSAISRAQAKVKETEEYRSMSPEDQKIWLNIIRYETLESR